MRVFLAFLFLLLGILGILLPVLPGVPFLIVSLYLAGLLNRRKFIDLLRRLGKRGCFQRKVVACVLVKIFYRRRFNLK